MVDLNSTSKWITRIAYIVAFFGIMGYVVTITGNMLDATEQQIREWKAGIKQTRLRDYLRHGVFYTLLLVVARLFDQVSTQPVNMKIFFLGMGFILGITNIYVSFRRIEILAAKTETSLIFRYKIAFAVLGVLNFVIAVIGYLVS